LAGHQLLGGISGRGSRAEAIKGRETPTKHRPALDESGHAQAISGAPSGIARAPTSPITHPRATVRQAKNLSSASVTSISRASALILLLPEKSLLDLGEDLVEPLLGAIRSLLVISYVRLQLRDPVFGGTKFLRELLGKFESVLTVRLGYTRCLVQQAQDAAAGVIQFIALAWRRAFRGRGKRDHRL
jgi:hypothetical protein